MRAIEQRLRGRGPVLAVTVVVAGVLTACSSQGSDVSGGSGAPEAQEVDVRRGEELYANNCARCHGTDLQGTSQGPPHLDMVYEPNHHGDAAFQIAVARGAPQHHWNFGPMPPIDGLSEADVDDIIAYVREQQRAVGIG